MQLGNFAGDGDAAGTTIMGVGGATTAEEVGNWRKAQRASYDIFRISFFVFPRASAASSRSSRVKRGTERFLLQILGLLLGRTTCSKTLMRMGSPRRRQSSVLGCFLATVLVRPSSATAFCTNSSLVQTLGYFLEARVGPQTLAMIIFSLPTRKNIFLTSKQCFGALGERSDDLLSLGR